MIEKLSKLFMKRYEKLKFFLFLNRRKTKLNFESLYKFVHTKYMLTSLNMLYILWN